MSKVLTNIELVAFARSKLGTAYVYGMKGKGMTQANFNYLQNTHGKKNVWDSDVKKVGKVCVDCSGLISWYTGKVKGSGTFKAESDAQPIKTIASAPVGVAVWCEGHIGIYIGNGEVIEARGSAYGTVKTKVKDRDFTHWFKLVDITYVEEDEEMKYNKLAEIPKWGKPTVEKLIAEKLLVGDGKGNLGIYESALQVFVVMDRKGLL